MSARNSKRGSTRSNPGNPSTTKAPTSGSRAAHDASRINKSAFATAHPSSHADTHLNAHFYNGNGDSGAHPVPFTADGNLVVNVIPDPPFTSAAATSATITTTSTTAAAEVGPSSGLTVAQQQEAWTKARQIHQQQLLTEHFGFSPLSFVDDVINAVNHMIYQASMALQEYVENRTRDIIEASDEDGRQDLYRTFAENGVYDLKYDCEKSMHKFETMLEAAVDKNFDRFELYALKNIFGITENVDVILPHYEALDFEIDVDQELKLNDEMNHLRRQLINAKALNYRLKKEQEIENYRLQILQKCRDQIGFLRDAVKEYSEVNPIPQTLIFVRDNIETLYRRFQSLHEKLEQNAAARSASSTGSMTTTTTSTTTTTTTTSSSTSAAAGHQGRGNHVSAANNGTQSADSVIWAMQDTMLGMEPDKRSVYIRSVVRRQIEDMLNSA